MDTEQQKRQPSVEHNRCRRYNTGIIKQESSNRPRDNPPDCRFKTRFFVEYLFREANRIIIKKNYQKNKEKHDPELWNIA